jgi:hypothetical protein
LDAEPARDAVRPSRRTRLPVSVIVPTLNAADWIVDCLTAIRANHPREVIVVDGFSSDGTAVLAGPLADQVLRAQTDGPAAARNIGGDAAKQSWVAFIDADVVLPEGSLEALLAEARERKLGALQAGFESSGSEYWSDQLAWHHNAGRSRTWFGVGATLMRRSVFRKHRFDDRLRSGEDVDLRLRLAAARVPVAVSDITVVRHRFAPGFAAARRQWIDDGAGLGRIVRKHGQSAWRLLATPFAAAAYWIARSVGEPRRLPYFVGFAIGNWVGAMRGLGDEAIEVEPAGRATPTGLARAALIVGGLSVVTVMVAVVAFAVLAVTLLRSAIINASFVGFIAAGAVVMLVALQIGDMLPAGHPNREKLARHRRAIMALVSVTIVLAALRLLATLRLFN